SLQKRCVAGLSFCVICRQDREHANAPYLLALLRTRRERPRRRAAEQRDEIAPFHCPVPPVLPTERIAPQAQYARRLLHCEISVLSMAALGHSQGTISRSRAVPWPESALPPLSGQVRVVSICPFSAECRGRVD